MRLRARWTPTGPASARLFEEKPERPKSNIDPAWAGATCIDHRRRQDLVLGDYLRGGGNRDAPTAISLMLG